MLRSTRIVLAVAQRLCKLGQCMTLDKDNEEERKILQEKEEKIWRQKQEQSRTRWSDKQTLGIKMWEGIIVRKRELGEMQGIESSLLIDFSYRYVGVPSRFPEACHTSGYVIDASQTLRQLFSRVVSSVVPASGPSLGERCLFGYWVSLHTSIYRCCSHFWAFQDSSCGCWSCSSAILPDTLVHGLEPMSKLPWQLQL